jgi:DNA-binding CsgD family transcriptional regulator
MSKIDTVQKRIGLLVSVIGIAVVFTTLINRVVRGQELHQALAAITVWFLFLTIIPFILSVFIESGLLKTIQIAVFFLTGGLNILSNRYQEFYGPAMFLAGWLLMRHYGFLETYPKTKNAIVLIMVVGFSQLSAAIHSPDIGAYAGLTTLAFSLFLIILILIIWRDMVRQQELLKQENTALKMNYGQLSAKLAELEEKQEPYDLKSVGISPAEERVIRVLSVYKASNREIAERLNIAESTVKLHLYNIYNKIGVDNRFAIIDLCKYNFFEENTSA